MSAAIHWFDLPRFYAEVGRVGRPGGIWTVWGYYHSTISPEVDAVLVHFADEVLAPLWGPGMRLNQRAYRDLDLPFDRLPWPAFHAEARMRLGDLVQYIRTWSASQAWERSRGTDAVEVIREDLERAWGDPQMERLVRWPLHGVIARLS